jgi:hypothetical protein
MPVLYAALDLAKNELRQAVVQNLAVGSPPSAPIKGQLWFDSTNNLLKWYDGTAWQSALGGAVSFGTILQEQTFGATKVDGVATTAARSDHGHGNPTHVNADHSAITLNSLAVPTGSVAFNNQKITNLADPTAANDGANKQYVDNLVAGLDWKASVRVATTAALTWPPNTLLTIDGITTVAGDRVLIKDQVGGNLPLNGIYIAATGSSWVRASDQDQATEFPGAAVFVEEGTVNADTAWTCTTNAPVTVNTTNIFWVQFAGGGAVTAGTGMTQSGNTLNVIAGDTSITVAADDIRVNTAVISSVAYTDAGDALRAKKFAAALTGTASPETVTHNLNTRDIMLTVLNGASPYTAVEVDWDATTVNTAVIRYNPNLGAGYRVVVLG